MYRRIITWVMSLALLCVLGLPQAQAFTHPCVPTTLEELDTIKANLDKQPATPSQTDKSLFLFHW